MVGIPLGGHLAITVGRIQSPLTLGQKSLNGSERPPCSPPYLLTQRSAGAASFFDRHPAPSAIVKQMAQSRTCDKGPGITPERVMRGTRNKNLSDRLSYRGGRYC